MIALATKDQYSSSSTSALGEQLQIPIPFLHQIAHILMKQGLIKATPGPKGGLKLGSKPESISLLDIYVALEGEFVPPVFENDENKEEPVPECIAANELWTETGEKICDYFDSIKLSDLMKKEEK